MELTFCKTCGQQLGEGLIGHLPACPHADRKAGYLPTGDEGRGFADNATVTHTLNRKQRRQAAARAKIRMRKENRNGAP